tara:strand:+ start:85 stop:264 length:180 start_codon:yes stop_codon:yes gene_type:complete
MIDTVVKFYDPNDETLLLHYLVTFVGDDKVYSVPLVEGNRHYQQVLQWVADGNEIGEPE